MRLSTGLIGLGLALGFSTGAAAAFIPGDINDDGSFDVTDAVVLRRALVDLGPGIAQLCGNGVIDAGEDCDLGELAGQTCVDAGFSFGTLSCGDGCAFDTSVCTNTRFVDNGDGTISDNQTGLMWEKKSEDGSIHDKDFRWTWSVTAAAPNGTAFTNFLGVLNEGTSPDGDTISGCFAGHCDWRLPASTELQTILLDPSPCLTNPCIDPIFGPTASDFYWSATSDTFGGGPFAWIVDFVNGDVLSDSKVNTDVVRAVRDGL